MAHNGAITLGHGQNWVPDANFVFTSGTSYPASSYTMANTIAT